MRGKSILAAAMVAAAAAGMSVVPAGAAPKATVTAPATQRAEQRRRQLRAVVSAIAVRGRPGWSVKAGQRMAKKARNVQRNRKAHRG